MRKKYLPFIAIAIMMFFVACSNEDIITEETTIPEAEGTITITASMPGDKPVTRVALTPDGKAINLTWQESDWLQFAYVQDTVVKKSIQLSDANISSDGKTVTFTLVPPTGIKTNVAYDIYGVYGYYTTTTEGGGISDADPTNVILTRNPGNRGTLELVQNRGDVMLYFKSTKTPGTPLGNVTFKHLGSLFALNIRNVVAPSSPTVTQARLVGVDDNGVTLTDGNWAFNNGAGGQFFDLVNEEFKNINTAGNYISFATAGSSYPVGETTTLWGWYPPLPNEVWPALRLEMTNDAGDLITPSQNIKPSRAAAPEAGKVYHFYAVWDGTNLNFTDNDFNVLP